jgi:hypothetical protein
MKRLIEESQTYVQNGSKYIARTERMYFDEEELASIKIELSITAQKLMHKHKIAIISYALNKHGIINQRLVKRGIITDELDGNIGFWYSTINTNGITMELLSSLEEEGLLEVV